MKTEAFLFGDYVVYENVFLYGLLLIYCIKKFSWHNVSVFLAALYFIGSIFSMLLYVFPLYYSTFTSVNSPTLEGTFHLWGLNALLILSLSKVDLSKIDFISKYNKRWMDKSLKFLVVLLSVYVLFTLPDAVASFFSGNDLGEMREESYGNHGNSIFIISLIARLFGATPTLVLAIASIRIFLLKDSNKWDRYGIYMFILYKFCNVFSVVSRATIVFSLLEVIVVFFIFFSKINVVLRKQIIKYSVIVFLPLIFIMSAITEARFDQSDKLTASLSNLRYAGEAQLNYINLVYPDLKDPFMGYRQFCLYRRLLGLPYDDGSTRGEDFIYHSYINSHYHWSHPVHVFFTMAGTWVMNWGFIIPYILAIWVFYKLRKSSNMNGTISFFTSVFAIIFASYIAKGMFFPEYQNESGNLLILFLFYLYLKLNKIGYSVKIKK